MAGISRLRNTALPVLRWLGSSQRRSYGAAAASQVDYDYDYDYEDGEYDPRREVIPATETEPAAPARGVQWVFMGNPAPKKRVYAERLSKLLEVPYISMGNLVRQELEPRSSLYKQIVSAVNEGKLVPEDIIFGLLSKRLEEGYLRGETGFILDGIPRTQIQAEILDQIADIDLVVNFKCTEGCLVSKHCGNGLCAHCQESLGMGKCGSSNLSLQLQQNQLKSTSMENAKMEKLRMYAEQRKPLEDYYRKQKKLIDVEVARGAGETWQGLLAALHLQHMNAVHPSHKLTA